MSWFRVDDGFHCHPKVMRAGPPAAGLYVRCGSYCAQQLSDLVIPAEIAKLYGTPAMVRALLKEGLWMPHPEGYEMRDYLDYNRSASQVKVERHAASERQKKARDAATSRRDKTVTHAEVTPLVTVPPTRPDPTQELVVTKETAAAETLH